MIPHTRVAIQASPAPNSINPLTIIHRGGMPPWENPGAELGDPIPQDLKGERLERLMGLQQPISLKLNQRLVGDRLPALVEGPLEEMELLTAARLGRQAPEIDGRLLINDGTAPAGSLVEVEITEAHPYDLVGTMTRVIDGAPESIELPVLG